MFLLNQATARFLLFVVVGPTSPFACRLSAEGPPHPAQRRSRCITSSHKAAWRTDPSSLVSCPPISARKSPL